MGAAPQGSGEGNDVAIMARARTRASSALFEVKLCEGTADNRNTNVLYLQGYCTKNPAKTHLQGCSLETSGFLDEEWRANGVTSSAHHGGGFFKFAAQPDRSKAFRVRHLLIGLLCATRRALAHGARGMLKREGSHRGGGSAHATLASGRVGFVASGCVKVPAEVLRRPPGCPAFPVMPGRAKGRIPESQLDYAASHMPSLRV